jgi:hypothetical protein
MSNRVRPRDTHLMKTLHVAAIALVAVAIGICFLLGTVGWFSVGFGVMTDCTDNYSCSSTGCSPCATTARWINVGGLAQLLLAGAGVGVLIRGLRTRRSRRTALGGAVLLVSSVLIFAGTTWRAQSSYCQPGSPGYRASYCSTDD